MLSVQCVGERPRLPTEKIRTEYDANLTAKKGVGSPLRDVPVAEIHQPRGPAHQDDAHPV